MSNGKKWGLNLVFAFGLGALTAWTNGSGDPKNIVKAGAAAVLASAVGVKTKLATPDEIALSKSAQAGK